MRTIPLAALLLVLCLPTAAQATDRVWDGSVSSSWHEADNWTPAGIPTANDDLTIGGTPQIAAAAFAKSVKVAAGLAFYSGGSLTLSEGGSSEWTGGFIDLHNAAIITIGGTFDAKGDGLQMRTGDAGGPNGPIRVDVTPTGIVTKTTGTGTVSFGAAMVNSGLVAPSTGTLAIRGPGVAASDGDVAPTGDGNVTLTDMTLASGASVSGTGGATAAGTVTVPSGVTFDPARLTVTGTLVLDTAGTAGTFSGGGIRTGAGELVVGPSQTTTLSGTRFRQSRTTFQGDVNIVSDIFPGCGGTLRLEGTTTWSAGFIDTHDAGIVENTGTFKPTGAGLQYRTGGTGCTSGPMEFKNLATGTVLREVGTSVAFGLTFTNLGTVDIQSGSMSSANAVQADGEWNMHANTLAGPLSVTGGVFKSAGTVTGNVSQTGGTIAPGASPGTLTISGDYSQADNAVLEVEIAGAATSEFDRLLVSGTATLAGDLNILTIGPFDPALTDSFTILTSTGARSGEFGTLNGAQLTGKRYYASYGSNSAVLSLAAGPVNTGKPTIAPTVVRPGDTLTCSPGAWTGSPTFTFAWLVDGAPAGTGTTYAVQAGDVGKSIVCRVTASNPGGPAEADSDPVIPVPQPPTNTGAPIVTSSATVGDTLTCATGTWSGADTITITWERDGVTIPGATGTTYVTTDADVGHMIVCVVTAANAGGATVVRTPGVTPSARATPTPVPTPAPTEPAVIKPSTVFTLPSTRKCVSRRKFRIRVKQPAGVTLKSVTVIVNGKTVKTNRGKRVTAPVDLRGLPKGTFVVKVRAVTSTGRKVNDKRRYRTCVPKKKG